MVRKIAQFLGRHPRLATWAVLAIGMVLIILLTSRDVPMSTAQRAALGVISVLLAGGCAWIIHWE